MGVLELSLIESIQNAVMMWGAIIVFGLILYYRYPKLSSGLKKIFKLKSKKKKDKIESSDEELIYLIQGYMLAYETEKYNAKEVIKKMRKILGE